MQLAITFSLAVLKPRENLMLEQVAESRGAGNVVKSFADSTMIRPMARKLVIKIHMMQNAARKNPDSSRKITVLVGIIPIVSKDGNYFLNQVRAADDSAIASFARSESVVLYVFPFNKNECTRA
jgi:hypothetical protein